ncbi:porin family protein [Flaviaesturariibacter aridisoli]|uniref:PorT family protein n=1 Tax=Flaviaesturariibacter aridisoli TaxID=2545761 RepID=A0A4R4DS24_9BACT|nr:porin family protein [Flaviaesturariibacter aridisoli]TCZ65281.1 PorT family protein [Flaviaesturariibacter aridisoli]
MKKLFAVVLLAGLAGTASAQLPKLGIKGGLNIANVGGSTFATSTRLSGHGGVLVHIHLAPSLALQPEVLFSGQGFKEKVTGTEHTWALDYLNVPFMLQYMFDNGFRVEAGPQVGVVLSAKVKDPSGATDIKNRLKQADFGVGFGVNYLSYSGLGIGARYNLGLSNINKLEGGDPLKNRVAQVSVFYMLDHSHKAKSR